MWPFMFLMLVASNLADGLPTPSSDRNIDVYSVHADKSTNTLLVMNPHPERATLRDITYYHVVETAYPASEGDKAASKTGSTDSENKTERAFTNAHGQAYEVIDDILPIVLAEMKGANEPDTNTEDDDVSINQADAPSDDETTYIYYDDEEISQDDGDNKIDAAKGEAQTTADEVEDDSEEVDEVHIDLKGTASTTEENTVTGGTIAVNDTAVTEETTTEKTSTETDNFNRHQKLFSSPKMLRERYLKMKNIIPTVKEPVESKERRKRSVLDISELKDIPEAPKLGPINYDSLPKYIRAMISTEKPNAKEEVTEVIEKKVQTDGNEHEKHRENLREKMEQMFSNAKAKETTDNDEIKGLGKQEDGIANLKTDKLRTYGMNISGDHGVVWNNLWSNAGMYYNVGEHKVDEAVTVEKKKEVSSSEKPPYFNKPASFELESGETEDCTKPNVAEPLLIDEDSNDIFVNINKEKVKDNPVSSSTLSRFDQNEDNGNMKQEDSIHEKPVDLKPLAEKKVESIPEFLNKLIEDDTFWEWITDWTAAYAELLIEHVGNTIKEEIEKQMSNKTVSAAQNQSVNKDMELAPTESSAEKSVEKNEIGVTNDKLDTKDTTGERKIIFTDEGEVVLVLTPETDNDDQEDLLKRRKHEDENKPDDDKRYETSAEQGIKKDDKIVAKNIFGNAMGSEKVTNIFVFAPLNNTEMILEKLVLMTGSDGASNTNSAVIENRFSDTSDNKTENKEDSNNQSLSGNQATNILTPNIEKQKNNDTDLVSKENSDKNQEKSDDTETKDITNISNDQEKEIEDLKEAHKKEIENLENEHKKEIEKLESDYKKDIEKYKSDEKNKLEPENSDDEIKKEDVIKSMEDLDMEQKNRTINEKKDENRIESDISMEIDKLNKDNKKEIEKLKRDFVKEIETLKSGYIKEIDTLTSIDQRKYKKMKNDGNFDAKSESVTSKINSEKLENTKETEKPRDKEIVKQKSDNEKEIEKLKSDHKKELEGLEKQYKDEIEKLKREFNKASENSEKDNNKDTTTSESHDKETRKLKGEEKPINDKIKEPESDSKESTEKKENEN